MANFESEFWPGVFNPSDIITHTQDALNEFNQFVQHELVATRLFGAIACKLFEQRPDEVKIETNVNSAKVGLEILELTGVLPERLANPESPISQSIYYPAVSLPDQNGAVLKEVVNRKLGVDSEIVSRIPWLHVISEENLAAFQAEQIDYLSDVSIETFCRSNLDQTGESDGIPPYSDIQSLFFSKPQEEKEIAEQERQKQTILSDQNLYIRRLRDIADTVENELR